MDLPSLDFKLMGVFLAVYDCKSVSAAALQVGMSQPGLSTALRRLREALGDPLFVRTPTGMEPTSRARELEAPIRDIIHLLNRKVFASRSFDPATATNTFRIAMSDIGEWGFLPPIMAALRAQAPNVRLSSVALRFDELERGMEAGGIDFALGYFPDLTSANIMETTVVNGAFGFFVGASNPLANTSLTIEQFCSAGHVVVEPIGRSHEVFETSLRARGIDRNVVLRTSNFLCVPHILAATDLIGVMPLAPGEPRNYWGVEPIGLPFDLPSAELKIYWHRLAHDDFGHRWLRQLIAQEFKPYRLMKPL